MRCFISRSVKNACNNRGKSLAEDFFIVPTSYAPRDPLPAARALEPRLDTSTCRKPLHDRDTLTEWEGAARHRHPPDTTQLARKLHAGGESHACVDHGCRVVLVDRSLETASQRWLARHSNRAAAIAHRRRSSLFSAFDKLCLAVAYSRGVHSWWCDVAGPVATCTTSFRGS